MSDDYNEEDVLDLTTDEDVGSEIEVITIDDTPLADRNRTPLPKDVVDEIEGDDLTEYSTKVKERISQMKKVWHDERRAKEAADRERNEAIKFASSIIEENKQLKNNLAHGEQAYANTLKHATGGEMEAAKKAYKDAYDSGDSDSIIEAQVRLNTAQMQKLQADNYIPQYNESPLQTQNNSVYVPQEAPTTPSPDHKALVWHSRNQWFGIGPDCDESMTGFAKGLHQQLVTKEGIDPTSDEYYKRIDSSMRHRFPDKFETTNSSTNSSTNSRTKSTSVVASATRSTAPKKVHLSSTQLAIAKKFGLTPEQYAREQIKLENTNGNR